MRENSNDYYVGSIQHSGEIKGLAIVGNSYISFIAGKIRVDMSPELHICAYLCMLSLLF